MSSKILFIKENEILTPAQALALPNPSAGFVRQFRQTDGQWYDKDSAGVIALVNYNSNYEPNLLEDTAKFSSLNNGVKNVEFDLFGAGAVQAPWASLKNFTTTGSASGRVVSRSQLVVNGFPFQSSVGGSSLEYLIIDSDVTTNLGIFPLRQLFPAAVEQTELSLDYQASIVSCVVSQTGTAGVNIQTVSTSGSRLILDASTPQNQWMTSRHEGTTPFRFQVSLTGTGTIKFAIGVLYMGIGKVTTPDAIWRAHVNNS